MEDHPIEMLMKTAMESIQKMINVNTVIGEPVETANGAVIIPVSKVSCGFAAGGSEFPPVEEADSKTSKGSDKDGEQKNKLPFGGGSGGGVSVKPVGFLVVNKEQVRVIPVEGNMLIDRLIDEAPEIIEKITGICNKKKNTTKNKDDEGEF
ncbi:MAG: GerW family sporulation protein [Eubacteriales bacterium]